MSDDLSERDFVSTQPDLGQVGWPRFVGLAIVFYLVLLVVWWYALDALTFISGNIAGLLFGFFDSATSIATNGKLVVYNVHTGQNTELSKTSALHLGRITYGLPMFAALAAATRTRSWMGKAKCVALGLGVFVTLSIPAAMLFAKMLELQLEDEIAAATLGASQTRAYFFYYAFQGYAFSQPVIAAALWMAVVLLGVFKKVPRPSKEVSRVSSGAPSPCGSGKKHRRSRGRK